MSTELEDRLRRLAPDLDVDRGLAEQRARQARAARRRRSLVGAGVAATLTVALAATGLVVLGRSSGDGDDVVTLDVRMQTTRVEQDGVEVAVTTPSEAMAGTRLWFDVVVRNTGTTPFAWDSGGCGIPVEAFVAPSGTPAAHEEATSRDEPRWDGDVGGLPAWLAEHNALPSRLGHQPVRMTGARGLGCAGVGGMTTVEPGRDLRHRGSVELRVPPGDLPGGGDDELVVTFQPYVSTEPGPMLGAPLAPVEVRAPLTVIDDPERTPGSGDAAVATFGDDPRLTDWIASTEVTDPTDHVQDFGTELSWWRGGWELWVDPQWNRDGRLRMRYDPQREQVIDVRIVPDGKAPDDEPEGMQHPEGWPDEVL